MEVVAERYVKWQEPEEEDLVHQLVERRTKHRIATSFDSEGGESVVSEAVSEVEDKEPEMTSFDVLKEVKNETVDETIEELSGKNVYFDKPSGAGFSNGTSGVQSRSTYQSVSGDGSEVTEESVTTTIQESHTIITTQHRTFKDVETEPINYSPEPILANGSQHLSFYPAVNGNGQVHFSNQRTDELGDILEGEPEPIDYNVEGVLKKQETHDLICPNCNTCITRRILVKKRKRVINDGKLTYKKDKNEDTGVSVNSTEDPVQNTLTGSTNINTTTDGQNDVITCWSCFSLLIPSGGGFKIFKVFGSKKQPDVSTAGLTQTPLLTSNSKGMSVNQGNTFNTVQLGNGNTVDQKQNIPKKGGNFQIMGSYGNTRNDNINSTHQISASQTSQFTTSSVEKTNAKGTTLSNHVEVKSTFKQANGEENSKLTGSLPIFGDGFSSGATNNTTDTDFVVKGSKTEAGTNLHNVSSTVMFSRDQYQITVNDKAHTDLDCFKDREPVKPEDIVSEVQGSTLLDKLVTDFEKGSDGTNSKGRDDVRISIENGFNHDVSSGTQNVSRDVVIPGTQSPAHGRVPVVEVGEARDWDILKSIVYGGLVESITSLGVVSSAAGVETATINVLALGLANLIGGLILIFHNLKDLKKSAIEGPSNQVDRYYKTLGQRNHITLHAVVVVLSFIIFGLIPIVTYAFTFRTSDNSDYKSLAVIGASFICIALLSIGKAHTKNPPRTARLYFKSITYYLFIAISASGLSYIAGKLLQELIEKTGWFDTTSSLNSIFSNTIVNSSQPAWGTY